MAEERKKKKRNTLAIIGSIVGFVALSAAFLSPWIAEAIDPPPPQSLQESLLAIATKLTEAAEAKVSGEERQGEAKPPSYYLPPAVIGCGMIGAGFGVGAFFAGEKKRLASCAVALGVSAAIVQWSIVIVVVLIAVLVISAIIGGDGR